MTIKELKEKYKSYKCGSGEKNSFVIYDYGEGNGKILIVVNRNKNKYIGKWVVQAVRVRDGKELLKDGAMRPCDNLNDAIDVVSEMFEA